MEINELYRLRQRLEDSCNEYAAMCRVASQRSQKYATFWDDERRSAEVKLRSMKGLIDVWIDHAAGKPQELMQ